MRYSLSEHIVGKVYDLTQENMNAMIADIERLRTALGAAEEAISHLRNSRDFYTRKVVEGEARLKSAQEKYAMISKFNQENRSATQRYWEYLQEAEIRVKEIEALLASEKESWERFTGRLQAKCERYREALEDVIGKAELYDNAEFGCPNTCTRAARELLEEK